MARWCCVLLSVLVSACATPRLQPPGGAAEVPRLDPDHARMADGTTLPMSAWVPPGDPRGVVLALHGFNDYRRSFEEVGAFLAARGFALYAFDQRGYGGTAHRGVWPGEATLAADVLGVAGLLRERHPNRPLYLLGESMGAAVALLSLREPGIAGIDGLVLVAPALWNRDSMPLLQRGALWLAAHTVPGLRLTGDGLNLRATDNDDALRKLREDPLVIKKTRVDTLWGMANLMDQAVAAGLPSSLPTLILYGARDEIIPRKSFCLWLGQLSANGARHVVVYPKGYHLLTRDLQAEIVVRDLAAWLADPKQPLPSGLEAGGDRPGEAYPCDGQFRPGPCRIAETCNSDRPGVRTPPPERDD